MIAYCEVSAFTDTPGQGNRAGVVLEAGGLSEAEMQALAAFVNRSFRRVEHAAESLIGKAGPLFVAIYVALVGTGMWIFCKSPHTLS